MKSQHIRYLIYMCIVYIVTSQAFTRRKVDFFRLKVKLPKFLSRLVYFSDISYPIPFYMVPWSIVLNLSLVLLGIEIYSTYITPLNIDMVKLINLYKKASRIATFLFIVPWFVLEYFIYIYLVMKEKRNKKKWRGEKRWWEKRR